MVFLTVLAIGVLSVALIHVVVGWSLASGLRQSALAVADRELVLQVRVRALEEGQIVLEAPEPRQDIGHPGTLGLAWDDGHGVLGDVTHSEAGTVTRPFRSIRGHPPVCEGELTDCPPVAIEGYVFHSPADVGLAYHDVEYEGPLGSMGAWLVPGKSDTKWAIHTHGWAAERRELVRVLPAFAEAGYSSMVIDYRNDAGMPRDPSGHHRFGLTEWLDLEAAVRDVLERGAEEIALTGFSTGGAIVLSFMERSALTGEVTRLVLDSPNLILADTIRHGTGHLRATPLMIEFGMWIADLRWDVDWAATNYVQRAEQVVRVPTLVFHGTSDHTVPISVSRQLAARLPDLVDLVEVPAAGHVMSWNADPTGYQRRVIEFLIQN